MMLGSKMAYLKCFLAFNIFLQSAIALPLSEEPTKDKDVDSVPLSEQGLCVDSEGNRLCKIYNLISEVFGIAKETVEVANDWTRLTGVNDNHNRIAQDYIDGAQESFDYIVETGVQYAKESIPPVKEFINNRLENFSSLGEYLESQVEQLPEDYAQELREKVDSLINILPREARPHPSITDNIERELPLKKYLKRWVGMYQTLIEGDTWVPPASERVEERLDEILEMLEGIEDKKEDN